jgi:uncharacterized RDD family membrane protein YckC
MSDDNLTYANLGVRALAFLIDLAIVSALGYPLVMERPPIEETGWEYCAWIVVLAWPYCAIAESSRWQGTVGKKLLGLRVSDLAGARIGFGRANVRYLAKVVTYPLALLTAAMIPVTIRSQGLHDLIARTVVLRVAN